MHNDWDFSDFMEVEYHRNSLRRLCDVVDPQSTYLVGGYVRDLLLNIETPPDIDLVTTVSFQLVAERLKQAKISHSRFDRMLTFKVDLGDLVVDLVRARREFYKTPGSISYCEEASLEEDCRRRDFTVNCLLLKLKEYLEGKVLPIDLVGGLQDLQNRLIRALRENQFEEDPARIVRAIRYATKLNFSIEAKTANLVSVGLNSLLFTTKSSRVVAEIKKLFDECSPANVRSTLVSNKFLNSQLRLLSVDFLEYCQEVFGFRSVMEKLKLVYPDEYSKIATHYGVDLEKIE